MLAAVNTQSTFFLTSGTNLVLYFLLAAVFIFCLIRCIAPLSASRYALTRGARAIRKGDKAKRSWRDEGFLGGSMQAGWSAFLKNQFFLEEQFGGSARVTDYISEDDVCPPERSALAESAPGILMALGFLGTLIGLWQGLPAASDMAGMLPAVRQTLAPAIAGAVLAVAFSLIHRASTSGALGALDAFSDALARHIARPRSIRPRRRRFHSGSRRKTCARWRTMSRRSWPSASPRRWRGRSRR